MSKPLVYMVRADLDDDYVEPHHAWYARKHAPDNMGAGFWSARGYDSAESPIMWNIYEVPDSAIFSSEAYNAGHKGDPFLVTAVGKLKGRTVSLYTQVDVVDGNGRSVARIPSVRGPSLTSLRFDTASDAAAIAKWFRDRVIPAHVGVAGVRTVRLWEQRESHPKWPSIEPRWSVGVEWASQDAIRAADGRGLLTKAAADPAIAVSKVKVDAIWKRYALVREDVFGD